MRMRVHCLEFSFLLFHSKGKKIYHQNNYNCLYFYIVNNTIVIFIEIKGDVSCLDPRGSLAKKK